MVYFNTIEIDQQAHPVANQPEIYSRISGWLDDVTYQKWEKRLSEHHIIAGSFRRRIDNHSARSGKILTSGVTFDALQQCGGLQHTCYVGVSTIGVDNCGKTGSDSRIEARAACSITLDEDIRRHARLQH